ncbi:acylphosphatase [Candidatus Kaiserbacteria bacterium]|nr:acylphosphatase [Candidatus Kaiserbacteria bacterium]
MFSEIQAKVSGKVQGVGYRDFVVGHAKEYGVFGWIRNNADGTVELLAQGEPDILKELVTHLNTGSSLAKVDSVAVDWKTPKKHFEDFEVWK